MKKSNKSEVKSAQKQTSVRRKSTRRNAILLTVVAVIVCLFAISTICNIHDNSKSTSVLDNFAAARPADAATIPDGTLQFDLNNAPVPDDVPAVPETTETPDPFENAPAPETTVAESAPETEPAVAHDYPYPIITAISGDVIALYNNGETMYVRLAGIAVPHDNAAAEYVVAWFNHDYCSANARIEYVNTPDTEEYPLVYMWIDNGDAMVQEILLQNGLAAAASDGVNTAYDARFEYFQNYAKEVQAGFYGSYGTQYNFSLD